MDIFVWPPGSLAWKGRRSRCALGRGGVAISKREGDGATPVGNFPLRRVMYRPDRLPRPETALPVTALGPRQGWCDDPGHPAYNRPVTLPFPASHEKLWRADALYDVVVELGYNDVPVVPGKGSAIFLHVAGPDYSPTQGCVALVLADLLDLLVDCGADARLIVGASGPPA